MVIDYGLQVSCAHFLTAKALKCQVLNAQRLKNCKRKNVQCPNARILQMLKCADAHLHRCMHKCANAQMLKPRMLQRSHAMQSCTSAYLLSNEQKFTSTQKCKTNLCLAETLAHRVRSPKKLAYLGHIRVAIAVCAIVRRIRNLVHTRRTGVADVSLHLYICALRLPLMHLWFGV